MGLTANPPLGPRPPKYLPPLPPPYPNTHNTPTLPTPQLKAVRDGAVVYQERSHLAVYFYFAVILFCLYMAPSPAFLALSLALMMLHMDLYGAVLHVVLDHAPFIDLPIISPGCLEFQWHHAIPRDIVSKPFVEVVSGMGGGGGSKHAH